MYRSLFLAACAAFSYCCSLASELPLSSAAFLLSSLQITLCPFLPVSFRAPKCRMVTSGAILATNTCTERNTHNTTQFYLQVMWKHVEQQSFHMTDAEYMEQLAAVSGLISEWVRISPSPTHTHTHTHTNTHTVRSNSLWRKS